jgi:hypothetical protein
MNGLIIVLSNAIIGLILLYSGSNISIDGENHGVLYLAMSLVLFVALQAMTINIKKFKISKPLLIIMIFVVWATIKTSIDTMNIENVKSITIGSTGGMLYFMLIGIMASRGLSVLNACIVKNKNTYVQLIFVVAMIWIALYLNYKNLVELMSEARTDLFLIEGQKLYYQRFASFLIIQNIVCGYLIAILTNCNGVGNSVIFIAGLLGYISNTIVSIISSQLVGSNAGTAFLLGYLLIALFCFYFKRVYSLDFYNNYKSNILSKGLFKHAIGFLIFNIIVLVLMLNYFVDSGWLNLSIFRITGFGEGEVSSITSRIEIIKQNFLLHLMHSPVFGNAQVDLLTTGEGTYIHSALSIITHLGLFCFVIFIVAILKMYGSIDSSRFSMIDSSMGCRLFVLFNKIVFIYVLMFSFMIAFYTWAPLWFILGYYAFYFFWRNENGSCSWHKKSSYNIN